MVLVYCCFVACLFFLKIYFMFLKGRVSGERERTSVPQMAIWLRLTQEKSGAWNSQTSHVNAGTKAPVTFFTPFLSALTGSQIRSGAVTTQTAAHTGYHCGQWLNPLCQKAGPESLFFFLPKMSKIHSLLLLLLFQVDHNQNEMSNKSLGKFHCPHYLWRKHNLMQIKIQEC